MPKKRILPGEVALITGLMMTSLAVALFVKSEMGMSVASGVPYVLYLILPRLSQGTWNALIQSLWLLVVAVGLRRFRLGYLLSFGMALIFGVLLDLWTGLFAGLPEGLPLRVLYYVLGFFLMAGGIGFFFRCGLPLMPFDLVPRAFGDALGWSVRRVRTTFDLFNLALMFTLGMVFLGRPAAIGIGTVLNAFLLGTGAGAFTDFLDRRFEVVPRLTMLANIS